MSETRKPLAEYLKEKLGTGPVLNAAVQAVYDGKRQARHKHGGNDVAGFFEAHDYPEGSYNRALQALWLSAFAGQRHAIIDAVNSYNALYPVPRYNKQTLLTALAEEEVPKRDCILTLYALIVQALPNVTGPQMGFAPILEQMWHAAVDIETHAPDVSEEDLSAASWWVGLPWVERVKVAKILASYTYDAPW